MLVVVGGHSRNLGKTSLVAGLIRKFRGRNWTAVKITQYGHHVCDNHDTHCGCEAEPGAPFALTEEYEPGNTDSARFLAAGAGRALWLRTPAGQLPLAAGTIQKILHQNENVIMESNSVVELVRPDLFLMMLDFGCADFKPSSLRFMDRADAFVVLDRGINIPLWNDLACGRWDLQPRFPVKPPRYLSPAVADFVSSRLSPPA